MGTSAVLKLNKKVEFPLVAKSTESDLHVLFTSNTVGTVIVSGEYHKLGDANRSWIDCLDSKHWTILDSVTITFKS